MSDRSLEENLKILFSILDEEGREQFTETTKRLVDKEINVDQALGELDCIVMKSISEKECVAH